MSLRRGAMMARTTLEAWRRMAALLLLMGTTLLSLHCEPVPEPAAEPESLSEEEVERLLSLGYVSHSAERTGPQERGVVKLDRDRAWPGYSLYSIRDSCTAELIDLEGNVVHSWKHDPCGFWANAELLPNGDLVVPGSDTPGVSSNRATAGSHYLLCLSWDGSVKWKTPLVAHHDVERTPAGQIVTLTATYRNVPEISQTLPIRDNEIALLSRDGEFLESRSLFDAVRTSAVPFPLYRGHESHDQVDVFHANTVEWMRRPELIRRGRIYETDNLLITMRYQDAIAIIDWSSGQFIWTWGHDQLSGPHDATVLDDGNILIFDNGLRRGWSRVIELDPITRTIVWEYRAPQPEELFSPSRGSSQRLGNGNVLLANSDSGHALEVTREGEIVWEFVNPSVNEKGQPATIVRMKRYAREQIELLLSGPQPASRPRLEGSSAESKASS